MVSKYPTKNMFLIYFAKTMLPVHMEGFLPPSADVLPSTPHAQNSIPFLFAMVMHLFALPWEWHPGPASLSKSFSGSASKVAVVPAATTPRPRAPKNALSGYKSSMKISVYQSMTRKGMMEMILILHRSQIKE